MQQTRLAKPFAALSIATDLGAGQPQGIAMSIAILAVRIGRLLNLDEAQLQTLYYAAVLRFIGCSTNASEMASLSFGEDGQLMFSVSMADWLDRDDLKQSLQENFKPGIDATQLKQHIDNLCAANEAMVPESANHCKQAVLLASRLPIPEQVVEILSFMYNRWDNKYPGENATDVPICARILLACTTVETMRRACGLEDAIEIATLRSGKQLDPNICKLLSDHQHLLFDGLDQQPAWQLFFESEPSAPLMVGEKDHLLIASCFADYVDQKSSWFCGHSKQVARLALRIASELKFDETQRKHIYIAGLIHDIGRSGVANRVWDKNSALNIIERKEAEHHSYLTEHILQFAEIFDSALNIASGAHERLDASGYHRNKQLNCKASACLAVADIYNALRNVRPWRGAFTEKQSAKIINEMVENKQLPRDVVNALFEVCQLPQHIQEDKAPAGLSHRENEVLACLIKGMSNKQICNALNISNKTVENHLTKVYAKTETTGRSQAALFAVKHELFINNSPI